MIFLILLSTAFAEMKLTEEERVVNCIIAIRNIEQDVGREDRELVCEVAKAVRMKFEGHKEQAVDCERICKDMPKRPAKSPSRSGQ